MNLSMVSQLLTERAPADASSMETTDGLMDRVTDKRACDLHHFRYLWTALKRAPRSIGERPASPTAEN
jgi:hypothetical protein